jgi:TPP-dependent indolepyruvate ferredoxin oxidoreductase alpha subunit
LSLDAEQIAEEAYVALEDVQQALHQEPPILCRICTQKEVLAVLRINTGRLERERGIEQHVCGMHLVF